MRLFTALLPPADVVEHLDEFLDAPRAVRPDLRWVHPVGYHLTLQFLGECGPYEVDRQLDRWSRRAARSAPMNLRLAGAGAFPQPFTARAVWIGLASGVESFRALAADDQVPHLTVARTAERLDLADLVAGLGAYAGPSWTADRLVLMESRTDPGRGPRYQQVESLPLGDQDPLDRRP